MLTSAPTRSLRAKGYGLGARVEVADLSAFLRPLQAAKVPLEPPEQTRLLDATADLPAVLGGGVPGAGGYDAVFAVAVGSDGVEDVRKQWEAWSGAAGEGGRVSVMPLAVETCGVRSHRVLPA